MKFFADVNLSFSDCYYWHTHTQAKLEIANNFSTLQTNSFHWPIFTWRLFIYLFSSFFFRSGRFQVYYGILERLFGSSGTELITTSPHDWCLLCLRRRQWRGLQRKCLQKEMFWCPLIIWLFDQLCLRTEKAALD